MYLRDISDVIRHLRSDVYVRLGSSKIVGIGVIAIRNIPDGIDPFQERDLDYQFFRVPKAAIVDDPKIRAGVKMYVLDICSEREGLLNFPRQGFNSITSLYLMNHSATPNVRILSNGIFQTMRLIKKDEELTIHYGTFNDSVDI